MGRELVGTRGSEKGGQQFPTTRQEKARWVLSLRHGGSPPPDWRRRGSREIEVVH
jgi:hypothetical protein